MDYIVYKTTNNFDEKFYVGVHMTEDHTVFDGYLGSGKILKFAIAKHGRENFKRETLVLCEDSDEMYSVESLLVKTKDEDIRSYNIVHGGRGNINLCEYVIRTVADAKESYILGGINGGNKCVADKLGWFGMTEEKAHTARLKGAFNGLSENKGIHTLDSNKRSEWAKLGGERSLGSLFYNDGIKNNKFNPNREILTFEEFLTQNPQFVEGKIFVSVNRKTNKGKISYNDGTTEFKFSTPDMLKIETKFLEFISMNPQFKRGRLCNPFKNNPESSKNNAGSRFYTDGTRDYKFFSSDRFNKELTESEFVVFLKANSNFSRGRTPKTKINT